MLALIALYDIPCFQFKKIAMAYQKARKIHGRDKANQIRLRCDIFVGYKFRNLK